MIKLETLRLPVRVRGKEAMKSTQSHLSLRMNSNKVGIMKEPHTSKFLPQVKENAICVLYSAT